MRLKLSHLIMIVGLVCWGSQTAYTQVPTSKLTAVNQMLQEKRYDEAVQALTKLLAEEPKNGRALFLLGSAYHSIGNFPKAIESFQANFAISNNPASLYNIAAAYARLRQADSTFEWLAKWLKTGAVQIANLRTDEDFANVRNDARFTATLEQIERQTKPCLYLAAARQFDFWLGDWDVFNLAGQKAGTNTITQISQGCGLLENWTGTLGGDGKSINYYDTNTGKWYQHWIGSGGGALRYEGEYRDGAMRFSGETTKNGKKTLNRLTFSKLDENTVRQFAEISNDDGRTWAVSYDFKYVRRK